MTQLVVKDLVCGYGENPAIENISLEVASGEVFAVLGANGAGKTTLLSGLSGSLRPWSGSVTLDGVEVSRMACEQRVRRGIVAVPEGHQVVNPLTVFENLELGAVRFGRGYRKVLSEELDAVYTLFPRLKDRRDQVSGTLSGGEQQMLAIGRALMARPEVILLDEPSLGLAPAVVESIYHSLADLKGRGLAVVLVEQNIGAALEMADRAALIRLGRVVQTGSAQDIGEEGLQEAYLGVAASKE
jgi:branched-chain amino acid transport system ATP-binding protein